MALQDLTPQLRTRLHRGERWVGLFVGFALLLLVVLFGYYLFHAASRKGWFLEKATYFTFVQSASGLRVGDKVKLMGFEVGEITKIETQPATDPYFNVYVEFIVRHPYYGYLWSDSQVKVNAGDFLGGRYFELTKGGRTGKPMPTYTDDNGTAEGKLSRVLIWKGPDGAPLNLGAQTNYASIEDNPPSYWLLSDEAVPLNERADELLTLVEDALPGVFGLTNQVAAALIEAADLSTNLNAVVLELRPTVTNLAAITTQIKDPDGSLGRWALGTNLTAEIEDTFSAATGTLDSANTNMTLAVSNLNVTLTTISELTGTLNEQVMSNTNILSEISTLVITANEFMQRLQKHWLLRSAFKESKKSRR